MDSVISIEDLTKRYRRLTVLDRLSLDVAEGSVFSLIGSNGVGKTTTIKILMNILKADSGVSRVLGVPSTRLGPAEFEKIGYVSENQQLPGWMTLDYLLQYLKPFYPSWDAAHLLHAQYKTRRTGRNRAVAAALLFTAVIGNFTISPAVAVELHTRMSQPPPFASQVSVDVDAKPRRFAFPKRDMVQISIPLSVAGIPPGVEAHIDAMLVTLDGNTDKWETLTIPSRNRAVSEHAFDSMVFVAPSFFASEEQRPLKLRGSLYITVFGGARSTPVTLTPAPVNVGDGLQCFVNEITSQLHCRSAFRWPALLVYAKVRDVEELLWPIISYSPFPAGIELNYTEEHQGSGPPPHAPQATILRMERQWQFRADFVIDQFNIADFTSGGR